MEFLFRLPAVCWRLESAVHPDGLGRLLHCGVICDGRLLPRHLQHPQLLLPAPSKGTAHEISNQIGRGREGGGRESARESNPLLLLSICWMFRPQLQLWSSLAFVLVEKQISITVAWGDGIMKHWYWQVLKWAPVLALCLQKERVPLLFVSTDGERAREGQQGRCDARHNTITSPPWMMFLINFWWKPLMQFVGFFWLPDRLFL